MGWKRKTCAEPAFKTQEERNYDFVRCLGNGKELYSQAPQKVDKV
jgi:hypothetical protein